MTDTANLRRLAEDGIKKAAYVRLTGAELLALLDAAAELARLADVEAERDELIAATHYMDQWRDALHDVEAERDRLREALPTGETMRTLADTACAGEFAAAAQAVFMLYEIADVLDTLLSSAGPPQVADKPAVIRDGQPVVLVHNEPAPGSRCTHPELGDECDDFDCPIHGANPVHAT